MNDFDSQVCNLKGQNEPQIFDGDLCFSTTLVEIERHGLEFAEADFSEVSNSKFLYYFSENAKMLNNLIGSKMQEETCIARMQEKIAK